MGLCGSTAHTKQRKLLLLGLDGAGKTSIALALEHPTEIAKPPDTVPSGQASAVSRKHNGLDLILWDLGGALALRPYWRHHYVGAQGIMFVVDAVDRELFPEAREALRAVAGDAILLGVPFVVVANRGTAPGAASTDQLTTELELAT
jgi:GTP-binding protein SAR1